MQLRKLAKDTDSGMTGCPTIYATEGDELVVQGPEVDALTVEHLENPLPGETAVRIPREVVIGAVDMLHAPAREVEPFSPKFRALFERAAHSIFRLEVLQAYAVGYEDEALRRFRAGEPAGEDDEEIAWYFGVLARILGGGGTMQRVHVVTEPLGEYLRFEFAAYDRTAAAGEDVRIAPVPAGGRWLAGVPTHDFWLFDSSTVLLMDYEAAGQLIGARVIEDPAVVVRHNRWRDAAVQQSMPYAEYRRLRREAGGHQLRSTA